MPTEANDQFKWEGFFREFAEKLLHYRDKRPELIAKIRGIYQETDIDLPTLDRGNQLTDIDPFTVLALFNKTSLKEINRRKLLSVATKAFTLSTPVPDSFDGVPFVNNLNATFYSFTGERKNGDIDELWSLLEAALAFAGNATDQNRKTLSELFDLAINKKWNDNSKITMALYWVAPETFLSLDQRSVWYIYESGQLPEEFTDTLPKVKNKIHSSLYFEIIEKLRAYLHSRTTPPNSFKTLCAEALRYSEKINQELRSQESQQAKNTALADEDVNAPHYWLYSPGNQAAIWDECCENGIIAIAWDPIGDLRQYSSKGAMKQAMKKLIDPSGSFKNGAHATWQFANEMKPGDIVFAKKGKHLIIGRGVVESDYRFDPERQEYQNVRTVNWTDKGEWEHPGQAVMKTLTDITAYTDYVEKLNALFESDAVEDADDPDIQYPPYCEEDFLSDVFMSVGSYHTLVSLVRRKRNVILQGAPGVGKTFVAKRLAYSMMGVKDPNRVKMVQFHQSYSYEDFVMGFRPSASGFELRHGVFYNFCKAAEIDSDNEYFFIIDEINRGNLSKIFGELFMLIENDKRGAELQLLYSGEKFSVPENVHLIGMMNTADRSLAMLDYALRRRFAFYELKPGFESDGFKAYQAQLESAQFNRLIDVVKTLNEAIATDDSLGDGFCIGHSFFCNLEDAKKETLSNIVEFELIPLLKEYWFDEPDRVRDWSDKLRLTIK